MNIDKLAILQELYEIFLHESKDEKKKLQENIDKAEEIESFLDSIKKSEEYDFKVFSPRSSEIIYKEKIEEKENEKDVIEKENQYHYHKLSKIEYQISQLEVLMKSMSQQQTFDRQLKVLDIQEKERQRIARELHDSSVQNLTHLVHAIELGSMYIDEDPIQAKLELETCIKGLKSTIDDIRETIFNFRPMSFDDLGFRQCIDDLISNVKAEYKSSNIEFNICELEHYKWKITDKYTINLLLVTIYRIIQEAIINAMKYSEAEKIVLSLECKEDICILKVKDNGKGFSIDKVLEQKDKHFGISIMQERTSLLSGRIDIFSEFGRGTEVRAEIPLL